MLSEMYQTKKGKYRMVSIICGILTNKQINKIQKQTHKYRELVVAREEGVGKLVKMTEGWREMQASSFGMSKSRG